MEDSKLKSARLLEQASAHLATDAGKEIAKKIGFVYQLNISPKKAGVDEEIFVVDLKKGAVTKGPPETRLDFRLLHDEEESDEIWWRMIRRPQSDAK